MTLETAYDKRTELTRNQLHHFKGLAEKELNMPYKKWENGKLVDDVPPRRLTKPYERFIAGFAHELKIRFGEI